MDDSVPVTIVEWSPAGEPLIFVPGLGSTASNLSLLASQFTDRYRCLGITRREASRAGPDRTNVSIERLAGDIEAVCSELGIQQATFIGHGFGCQEIARIATQAPALIRRAVLIDGTFDRSEDGGSPQLPPPFEPPAPTLQDMTSLDRLVAFLSRVSGVRYPEAEVRELYPIDPADQSKGYRQDQAIAINDLQAMTPPAWSALSGKPTLAIFAAPHEWQVWAPYMLSADREKQQQFEHYFRMLQESRQAQLFAFLEQLPEAMVGQPEYSPHDVHLSHEWLVTHWIKALLAAD